jgi:hypothetical protein
MSDPPATLRAAVRLVWLITVAELAWVGLRDGLAPGGRMLLGLVIALQLLLGRWALARHAGAVFGLFLFQGTAVLAAIGAKGLLLARASLAATAIVIIVLLAASAHAFPSPQLPTRGPT